MKLREKWPLLCDNQTDMDGTARLGHFRVLALTLNRGASGSLVDHMIERLGALVAALVKPRMTVKVTASVTDHKVVPAGEEQQATPKVRSRWRLPTALKLQWKDPFFST